MIIVTETQRDPAWYQARLGRLTGSRASDILATIKTGEAAARRDYRLQLVCERLTGQSQEDAYVNAAMQRGIDKEEDAFAAYEALTGRFASPVGFVAHDSLMAGCSADGQVDGWKGLLELKCPKSATHLGYLRSKAIPSSYRPQLLHNLWITGAQWVDFLSFDDRFPPELQVFYARLERNQDEIDSYSAKAVAFLSEVDYELVSVRAMMAVPA